MRRPSVRFRQKAIYKASNSLINRICSQFQYYSILLDTQLGFRPILGYIKFYRAKTLLSFPQINFPET